MKKFLFSLVCMLSFAGTYAQLQFETFYRFDEELSALLLNTQQYRTVQITTSTTSHKESEPSYIHHSLFRNINDSVFLHKVKEDKISSYFLRKNGYIVPYGFPRDTAWDVHAGDTIIENIFANDPRQKYVKIYDSLNRIAEAKTYVNNTLTRHIQWTYRGDSVTFTTYPVHAPGQVVDILSERITKRVYEKDSGDVIAYERVTWSDTAGVHTAVLPQEYLFVCFFYDKQGRLARIVKYETQKEEKNLWYEKHEMYIRYGKKRKLFNQ
jgi:hypothetical protein